MKSGRFWAKRSSAEGRVAQWWRTIAASPPHAVRAIETVVFGEHPERSTQGLVSLLFVQPTERPVCLDAIHAAALAVHGSLHRMQAKGAATSTHPFNSFRDIATRDRRSLAYKSAGLNPVLRAHVNSVASRVLVVLISHDQLFRQHLETGQPDRFFVLRWGHAI